MKIKKLVAFILCICIFCSTVMPRYEAHASDFNVTAKGVLMETIDKTPVRTQNREEAQKVCTLNAGVLVSVVEYVQNEKSNYWYKTIGGQYIYESHLVPHSCSYSIRYESEDQTFDYCKCGAAMVTNKKANAKPVSLTAAAIAAGSTLAAPVITDAVIKGAILVGTYCASKIALKFIVNAVGNIEIISPEKADRIERDNRDSSSDEVYFPAITLSKDDPDYDSNDALFVFWNYGMDIDEAVDFLVRLAEVRLLPTDVGTNVYTFNYTDAEKLAQRAAYSTHVFRDYGSSNVLGNDEIDKGKVGYYHHFHLYTWDWMKAKVHIFYGTPSVSSSYSAV